MKNILLIFFTITIAAGRMQADTLIEHFDDRSAGSRWTFNNGGEFPGANGSFVTSFGNSSVTSGFGRLTVDFTKGGEYVLARRLISPAITSATSAITVATQLPPGLSLFLRVEDASGQTLHYVAPRPLEYTSPRVYYTATFDTRVAPLYFWGGANNSRITGGIVSISLGVSPLKLKDGENYFAAAKTGVVALDTIRQISSSTIRLYGNERVIGPTPSLAPMLRSQGVSIHFTDNPAALDAAAAAGFDMVRMDLFWSWAETSRGIYNFTRWDKLINDAKARGLRTLLILDYGNPFYTGSSKNPPVNPESRRAFGNFAEAAARHFAGKKVCYEIWNEPNYTNFWPPVVNAIAFSNLIKETVGRIKVGDPYAEVVSGGLSGTDFGFLKTVSATGALDQLTAVGVHPYDANGSEGQIDALVYFESLLTQRATATKSVWNTECGFSSSWYGPGKNATSQHTQAKYVLRQVLGGLVSSRSLNVVYDLIDDGLDPYNQEHNFGLYAPDLTPKASGKVLRYLWKVRSGKSVEGMVQLPTTLLHAVAMRGATQRVFVLWTENKQPSTVLIPSGAVVSNMYGQALTPGTGGTVTVNSEPVYVFMPL